LKKRDWSDCSQNSAARPSKRWAEAASALSTEIPLSKTVYCERLGLLQITQKSHVTAIEDPILRLTIEFLSRPLSKMSRPAGSSVSVQDRSAHVSLFFPTAVNKKHKLNLSKVGTHRLSIICEQSEPAFSAIPDHGNIRWETSFRPPRISCATPAFTWATAQRRMPPGCFNAAAAEAPVACGC